MYKHDVNANYMSNYFFFKQISGLKMNNLAKKKTLMPINGQINFFKLIRGLRKEF